jgi:hypothetical protein
MCFNIVKEYAAPTLGFTLFRLLSFHSITANNAFHTLLDRLPFRFVDDMDRPAGQLLHALIEDQSFASLARFPSTLLLVIVLVFLPGVIYKVSPDSLDVTVLTIRTILCSECVTGFEPAF